jgi:LCP family protein required for cell wall assembly
MGQPLPGGRRDTGRRWPRRVLIATNVFVAVMLVGAASVFGYVSWRFGQIRRISIHSLGIGGHAAPAGSPMTILVVGSDNRSNLKQANDKQQFGSGSQVAGQRSDTIILLRVNPGATQASIMSIPRDLWVDIPGKNYRQRINTTFDTGPDLLVQAIHQNLGIQVDHYMEVNFDSFRQIVNAVGGIKEYFPTRARDVMSGLLITAPGCYTLSGDQALGYVRSRHYEYYANGSWHFEAESDLARIKRQQQFIKKMLGKVQSSGLTDPLALNNVVSGVTTNLTVDKGLSQRDMLNLAKRFRSLSPANLPTTTLPTYPQVVQGNDVLLLKQPDAQQAIATFLGESSSSPSSTPAATAKVNPGDVRIQVLNGTGVKGQASQTEAALRGQGFLVTAIGTATGAHDATSIVRYANGANAKAALVASSVIGGAQLQADPTLQSADVILVTGQSYRGVQTPTSTPATAKAPAAPGPPAAPATPPTTGYQLPGTPAGSVPPPC